MLILIHLDCYWHLSYRKCCFCYKFILIFNVCDCQNIFIEVDACMRHSISSQCARRAPRNMRALFTSPLAPSTTPKEEISKDGINRRTNAFRTLSSNYIGEDDGRRLLLQYSKGDWKRALHPALHSFVPMLSAMASYFQNTWHFISTTVGSRSIHGHEAMRRILWNTIKDMNMNIPIDNKPVQVTIPANPSLFMMNTPTITGNKRKINV